MINVSGDDEEDSSWSVNRTRKRGTPRQERIEESEPPKAVKATSIPDEHHSKLLVIVSAFDGFSPFSTNNPIKMATLINKEFVEVSSAKKLRSGDIFNECKSVTQREMVLTASYFGGVRVSCRIPRYLRES